MFTSSIYQTFRATNRLRFWRVSPAILLVSVIVFGSAYAPAQGPRKGKEKKIPDMENITLETKDGVQLRCSWYAGTSGKKAVPIIMLHGWSGSRGEFDVLATQLQRLGHAVIVPDLRGHGDSAKYIVAGEVKEIDRERLGKKLLAAMSNDVETIKKFLMQKNNEGELNVNSLCVVASEEMSIVAMDWAIKDWSWPMLTTGKQGQDVKMLVLLSPVKSFKGLTSNNAVKHWLFTGRDPRQPPLSLMILAGSRDRQTKSYVKSMYSSMEGTRPKLSDDLSPAERLKKQDLYLILKDVELKGTKLLDPDFGLKLDQTIAGFIRVRLSNLADEKEYEWSDRSK